MKLSYGRRDVAKAEGRKTEKGMVERVVEGEWAGKNILLLQNVVTWREGPKSKNSLLKHVHETPASSDIDLKTLRRYKQTSPVRRLVSWLIRQRKYCSWSLWRASLV